MATQVDLTAARSRATRALDGMTVNRDVMAREHIAMCDELQNWRSAFERMKRDKASSGSSFKDAFDEMFGSTFGTKP